LKGTLIIPNTPPPHRRVAEQNGNPPAQERAISLGGRAIFCAWKAREVCYLMENKVTEALARSPTNGRASGETGAVQLPQTNALVRLSIQESVH
jgi:hypothetical protein